MLKESLSKLFKSNKDIEMDIQRPEKVVVDADVIDEPKTEKSEDYNIQELLAFYMEQARSLTEKLNEANQKNLSLEEELSRKSDLILEKDTENAAIKLDNVSLKKKVTSMKKKITRLSAIEKVWKDTFSKLNIVSGSISPTASVNANKGEMPIGTAFGEAYSGKQSYENYIDEQVIDD